MESPADHIPWLLSRATGLAAMLMLSLSVAWGLSFASRMAKRGPGSMTRDKVAHEALSLAALVLIALHGGVLLFDNYISPSIWQILVPFQMPDQSVWVGIGIIAGWIAFISGLAHYAKKQLGRRWKIIHRFTLLAWILALVHTIGSGPDTSHPLVPVYLLLLVLPVFFSLVYRLLPGK